MLTKLPKVAIGISRGRVPTDPQPLPAIRPVDFSSKRKPVGSALRSIEEVVQALAGAFVKHAGSRAARPLLDKMDTDWRHVVRLMASDLMDEDISPSAFVAFVVGSLRRRGRPIFAGSVFTMKHFPTWLATYRAHGAPEVKGYTATPGRRRLYEERVRARRLG